VEAGVLAEGEPVELIDGELFAMSPQGPYHYTVARRIGRMLREFVGPDLVVREDGPIDASPFSQPEPDVCVAVGSEESYRERHPRGTECRLVVEVSLTTKDIDTAKAHVYAAAGVEAYWVVDLRERTVSVHETPRNGVYHRVTTLSEDLDLPAPGSDRRLSIVELMR
jgi:Uma2 family endonuclease